MSLGPNELKKSPYSKLCETRHNYDSCTSSLWKASACQCRKVVIPGCVFCINTFTCTVDGNTECCCCKLNCLFSFISLISFFSIPENLYAEIDTKEIDKPPENPYSNLPPNLPPENPYANMPDPHGNPPECPYGNMEEIEKQQFQKVGGSICVWYCVGHQEKKLFLVWTVQQSVVNWADSLDVFCGPMIVRYRCDVSSHQCLVCATVCCELSWFSWCIPWSNDFEILQM